MAEVGECRRHAVRAQVASIPRDGQDLRASGVELGQAAFVRLDMRCGVRGDQPPGRGEQRQGQSVGGAARRDRKHRTRMFEDFCDPALQRKAQIILAIGRGGAGVGTHHSVHHGGMNSSAIIRSEIEAHHAAGRHPANQIICFLRVEGFIGVGRPPAPWLCGQTQAPRAAGSDHQSLEIGPGQPFLETERGAHIDSLTVQPVIGGLLQTVTIRFVTDACRHIQIAGQAEGTAHVHRKIFRTGIGAR